MEKPPEEIRSEIDDVREDLGETLEAIGDRVAPKKVMARAKADAAEKVEDVKHKLSPRRLAGRGADAVRGGVRSAVGSGAASTESRLPQVTTTRAQSQAVAERARGAASTIAGNVGDAPQAVRQRAEGNPVAAGLLAFAAGFFAAALLPATERERQLVEKAKEGLQPLADQAAEVGKSVAGELQSTAMAGLEAVKGTAADAVEEVKGQTQSSADRVKTEGSDATQAVAGRAKVATKKVQKRAKAGTGAVKGEAKSAAKRVTGTVKTTGPTTKRVPSTTARPPRPGTRPTVVVRPRRRP